MVTVTSRQCWFGFDLVLLLLCLLFQGMKEENQDFRSKTTCKFLYIQSV